MVEFKLEQQIKIVGCYFHFIHFFPFELTDNYKVTRAAKSLQKVSKQEVGDIETCPECYLNANTMTDNWFTEVCARPHLILWAKLKGYKLNTCLKT